MLDSLGKDYDLFEQGQEDVFTTEAKDIGPIHKIRSVNDVADSDDLNPGLYFASRGVGVHVFL